MQNGNIQKRSIRSSIIFKILPTKSQQLNLQEKEKVRIKVFTLEIDHTEMKKRNEIKTLEFLSFLLILPAFYRLN